MGNKNQRSEEDPNPTGEAPQTTATPKDQSQPTNTSNTTFDLFFSYHPDSSKEVCNNTFSWLTLVFYLKKSSGTLMFY
jgi:hypothetical protein